MGSKFVGNPVHFRTLKKAAEASDAPLWNQYVKTRGSGFKANLRGISLECLDLSEFNLNNALLHQSEIVNCSFNFTGFENAVFDGSVIKGCIFKNARFINASFNNVKISESQLNNADFSSASLSRSVFDVCNMEGALLKNADLTGVKLTATKMNKSDLSKKVRIKTLSESGPVKKTDTMAPWKRAVKEEEDRKKLRLKNAKDKETKEMAEKMRKKGRESILQNPAWKIVEE